MSNMHTACVATGNHKAVRQSNGVQTWHLCGMHVYTSTHANTTTRISVTYFLVWFRKLAWFKCNIIMSQNSTSRSQTLQCTLNKHCQQNLITIGDKLHLSRMHVHVCVSVCLCLCVRTRMHVRACTCYCLYLAEVRTL